MLLLSGTLPVGHDDSITVGRVKYDGVSMSVGSREIPSEMRSIGATALMAAASKTAEALGMEAPIRPGRTRRRRRQRVEGRCTGI